MDLGLPAGGGGGFDRDPDVWSPPRAPQPDRRGARRHRILLYYCTVRYHYDILLYTAPKLVARCAPPLSQLRWVVAELR